MQSRPIHNIDEYRATLEQLFDELDDLRAAMANDEEVMDVALNLVDRIDGELKVLFTKVNAETGHLECGDDLECVQLLHDAHPVHLPFLDLLMQVNDIYKYGYHEEDGLS